MSGRCAALEAALAALVARPDGGHRPSAVPVVVERTLFGMTSAFGLGAVAVVGYAIAAGLF